VAYLRPGRGTEIPTFATHETDCDGSELNSAERQLTRQLNKKSSEIGGSFFKRRIVTKSCKSDAVVVVEKSTIHRELWNKET